MSLEATVTFLLGYIGIYLSAAYLRHDAGHDIENQHIVLTSLVFSPDSSHSSLSTVGSSCVFRLLLVMALEACDASIQFLLVL